MAGAGRGMHAHMLAYLQLGHGMTDRVHVRMLARSAAHAARPCNREAQPVADRQCRPSEAQRPLRVRVCEGSPIRLASTTMTTIAGRHTSHTGERCSALRHQCLMPSAQRYACMHALFVYGMHACMLNMLLLPQTAPAHRRMRAM